MDLNELLKVEFGMWKPPAPVVKGRSKGSITLDWQLSEPFAFLGDNLIYTLVKREKIPPWITVYSGGRSTKTIDNLAPRHPHRFRLRVVVKASAVDTLGDRAVEHYGTSGAVVQKLKEIGRTLADGADDDEESAPGCREAGGRRWLQSRWSDETWTSTDTDGSSALCFCMAVRCGYIGQLQAMLRERPELVDAPAPGGLTPLATAVTRGDVEMVRFLLRAGADVNLALGAGRTPLHLAALGARAPIIRLLLDSGADLQVSSRPRCARPLRREVLPPLTLNRHRSCVPLALRARDVNGMRAEHFAADSGDARALAALLPRGGELHARDACGWTPLFRAVCQGANTEMIEELVARGSRVDLVDRAGLALVDAARLLRDEKGRRRDSVLRRVDAAYPREAALAHFSRLTKKISTVHSLFK